MPDVSLSRTVTKGCATFTVNNLLINDEAAIDETNFKIYDVFVELGDGNFMSFFTREVETDERDTTYNSQFTYKYKHEGIYTPVANMKAVYSDDGDPKYPTAPTINTGNDLTAACEELVENKINLPEIKTGPRIARSHMPKFGERNTYIINYANLINNPDFQNIVIFFYNQKEKKLNSKAYTQWDPILNMDQLNQLEVTRIAPHITRLAAGTIADLQSGNTITALQNTPQSVLQQTQATLQEFTHYMAFAIDPNITDRNAKNLFVSLTGHSSLVNALDVTPEQSPETLNVAAIHFYRSFQPGTTPVLYAAEVYRTPDDELTRFHDPNFIKVQPTTVDQANIQTTEYNYKIFCSNDGASPATFVRLRAYIDFDFFDVIKPEDVEVISSTFPEKREVTIGKQHIAFTWRNIALTGNNGDLDLPISHLKVAFKLKPKANPAKRKNVTAFAEIDMGVGNIIDTTLTPRRARIKIEYASRVPNPDPNPNPNPNPDPTPNPNPTPGNRPGNQGCRNLGCSVFLLGGLFTLLWWII